MSLTLVQSPRGMLSDRSIGPFGDERGNGGPQQPWGLTVEQSGIQWSEMELLG